MNPGAAIAIGIGVGAAIGVAVDNLSVGVGIGAAIGAVGAFALSRRGNAQDGDEPRSDG